MTTHTKERQRVIAALSARSVDVFELLADLMINLGCKVEWDMEDNFWTTESIAGLATDVGLPRAGDQDDEAIRFWLRAAGDPAGD